MRKMKLSVLFAAAVAVLGLTSCLNGDENTIYRGVPLMKYAPGYLGSGAHFEDRLGNKFIPDKEMALTGIKTDFAMVPLQYDTQLFKQNQSTRSYDITLLGDPDFCPKDVPVMNEIPADQKTVSFGIFNEPMSNLRGFLWEIENENLIFPVFYFLNKEVNIGDKAKLKEELAKHQIEIYSPSGKNLSEAGDSLKLFVRYTIKGIDTENEDAIKKFELSYTQPFSQFRYIPVKSLLAGKDLTKLKYIRVEYEAVNDFQVKATFDPKKKKTEVVSYELNQKQ